MTTKKDDVLIKVEGLHKIYGDFHALNGIDEEIHRGEAPSEDGNGVPAL